MEAGSSSESSDNETETSQSSSQSEQDADLLPDLPAARAQTKKFSSVVEDKVFPILRSYNRSRVVHSGGRGRQRSYAIKNQLWQPKPQRQKNPFACYFLVLYNTDNRTSPYMETDYLP